ncbi:hypothetical protein T310_8917, partial [Rasamsonia emersonii CBS 393.64]
QSVCCLVCLRGILGGRLGERVGPRGEAGRFDWCHCNRSAVNQSDRQADRQVSKLLTLFPVLHHHRGVLIIMLLLLLGVHLSAINPAMQGNISPTRTPRSLRWLLTWLSSHHPPLFPPDETR